MIGEQVLDDKNSTVVYSAIRECLEPVSVFVLGDENSLVTARDIDYNAIISIEIDESNSISLLVVLMLYFGFGFIPIIKDVLFQNSKR